jgi:hypothetical protein
MLTCHLSCLQNSAYITMHCNDIADVVELHWSNAVKMPNGALHLHYMFVCTKMSCLLHRHRNLKYQSLSKGRKVDIKQILGENPKARLPSNHKYIFWNLCHGKAGIKAAISLGLACPSKNNHSCLYFQWHHWKSLGDYLWTSSDVTGTPAVSGSPTRFDRCFFMLEHARPLLIAALIFAGSSVDFNRFWPVIP